MDLHTLIEHAKKSIENAFGNISKLSDDILKMEGMSGDKTRHLYNNMCNLKGITYVEVGTWKGSSFISAMYKNENVYGISIDNWSQFESPKDIFHNNIKTYLLNNSIKLIDKDCWKVDHNDIDRPIDVYMYDGAHEYQDQKDAITYFHQFFSKYVIIMIDDWTCHWAGVREATMEGILKMKMIVHYSYEIPLVNTKEHHRGGDTFWNGCGVFVCERTDI